MQVQQQGICIDLLLFLKIFNGLSLNGLESFISEKERFEVNAPGFDADAERSGGLGPRWDMKTCTCTKAQLQIEPAFCDSGNDSCIRVIIMIIIIILEVNSM